MSDGEDDPAQRARSPRVSMADIARLANVSKPTVSRVLSGSSLVNPATRDRVLEVARAQGYRINRTAQKLRQTHSDSIGVVLDFGSYRGGRIADPFVFDLLTGVSEALALSGLDLLLAHPGKHAGASYFHDQVTTRMVDGFIFLGQGSLDPVLRELGVLEVPFVVWGAVDPKEPYCAVGSDNHYGGWLAGGHFRRRQRFNWLFVGDVGQSEVRLRYEGLCQSGRESWDPVAISQLRCSDMSYTATFRDVGAWLAANPAPNAVFAYSDTAAMAVIAAFREHGLEAPRDYALVGYNNIPLAAHYTPAITTIEQQTHIAGAMLVDRLQQLIAGDRPGSTVLPTRLIERQT